MTQGVKLAKPGRAYKHTTPPDVNVGTPVSRMMYDCAYQLRNRFKLTRLQSEWVCFRASGTIEAAWRARRTDVIDLGEQLYQRWNADLNREFSICHTPSNVA